MSEKLYFTSPPRKIKLLSPRILEMASAAPTRVFSIGQRKNPGYEVALRAVSWLPWQQHMKLTGVVSVTDILSFPTKICLKIQTLENFISFVQDHLKVAPYSFLKSGQHMFQTENLVHWYFVRRMKLTVWYITAFWESETATKKCVTVVVMATMTFQNGC